MGSTNFDQLDAVTGRIKLVSALPTAPSDYYGANYDVGQSGWRGGEMVYLTTENRIYVQQATSGNTATWKRLVTQFATSTTSSSTSSSTSTSTSTSSSSSSSSTTSSSTTTMA